MPNENVKVWVIFAFQVHQIQFRLGWDEKNGSGGIAVALGGRNFAFRGCTMRAGNLLSVHFETK